MVRLVRTGLGAGCRNIMFEQSRGGREKSLRSSSHLRPPPSVRQTRPLSVPPRPGPPRSLLHHPDSCLELHPSCPWTWPHQDQAANFPPHASPASQTSNSCSASCSNRPGTVAGSAHLAPSGLPRPSRMREHTSRAQSRAGLPLPKTGSASVAANRPKKRARSHVQRFLVGVWSQMER